jgi:XTP/dITP diphosphohydrolase
VKEIVLASRNPGKARELTVLIDIPGLVVRPMSDFLPPEFVVEETGATFEENAWLKASAVCEATERLTLADDSGLEVDALDGRPGVHSARFAGDSATDEQNNALLLEQLRGVPAAERTARFRVVLTVATWREGRATCLARSEGVLEGRITFAPRGSGGFGYDCLFEPDGHPGITTAEMTASEKNAISHRGQAASGLNRALSEWFDGSDRV